MRAVLRLAWFPLWLSACSALVDADPSDLAPAGDRPPSDQDTDDVQGSPDGSLLPDGGQRDASQSCGVCDDGIECTVDFCEDGACQYVAEDDLCAAEERCNSVRGCVSRRCRTHADCDDANVCNGVELCDPGAASADSASGCVASPPLDCDDKIACTSDVCDPAEGCVHTSDDGACSDGIDCTIDRCDPTNGCEHEVSHERCTACFIGSYCSSTTGCEQTIPLPCTDLDPCTVDRCDVELGMCVHVSDADNTSCEGAPDVCERVETLTLDETGKSSRAGSFGALSSDYNSGCGQSGGRDAVYRLELDEVVDVFIDTSGSSARTVLGVSPGACGEQGFGFGCAESASETDSTSRLVLHQYDPAQQGRELFILVDAVDANEGGNYVLNVRVAKAASDRCAAEPLALDACGTVIGFIESREPENYWGMERGGCQSGPGRSAPEAIFVVPGASDGNVSVVATSDAFAPAMYARTVCDNRDSDFQLGCENSAAGNSQSGRADFTFALNAPERAYVIVDGGHNGAKYTLRCVQ